jgi:DNA-binding SARP family transcriptional activator
MRTAATGESAPAIRFGILGPLTVELGGVSIALGPLKQQQVLAMLLCQANTVTSLDALTDTLWDDDPPRTARKNLQVYIACLRRLLGCHGSDRLIHRNGGYLLRVETEELDLLRFQRLVGAARQASGTLEMVGSLADALRLWRGPALDGLTAARQLGSEADRLSMRYVAVFEDWADGELALGHADQVVEQICDLAARHPFRERLRQLQMTALHRANRRAEALGVFDELRQSLARELGLRPSPATERVYRTILNLDPAARTPAKPPAGARTVLPPDLTDFTGRTEPLRKVEQELVSGTRRVVVVTGPVGIGKTSLAVHAAHRVERLFPDGRIFLNMRTEQGVARSPRSVLLNLLRFAGLAGQPGQTELTDCDTEDLASRWQSWLLDRTVLLVLDDAGEAAPLRAVLPLSGASMVVSTSRRRLSWLEYAVRLELPPMAPAEAVSLLGRIIGAERVRREPAAAASIVDAIGLSPLAVRTAGIKLAMLRHVSLAEFAERLAQPDELLAELCTLESGLRGRLAVGLSELPEPERSALQRLAALGTSWFTLDQAAAELAEVPGRVRRLLESLVEANAVTVPMAEVTAHAAVYELPLLLRCYVRELAAC